MSSTTNTVKKTRGRPATKQATRAKRPTRIPMSGQRLRMHVEENDKDPNFHYAWINDQKDLIFRAKRAGYEHVQVSEIPGWGQADVDSSDSTDSLITMRVGGDVTAYLMKQPIEFHDEDEAEMQTLVDAREADMKKNLNSGQDGTYGSVDIKR